MKTKVDKLVCFDVESTGVSVEDDRIIQAFVGLMGMDGEWIEKREWLIDPGIEVPQGASDVHGYTTERIREVGRKDADAAIFEIYCTILEWTNVNSPLVIFNARYDTSILDRELGRQHKRFDMTGISVVDPFVCDKAKFKYRKGSRKLVDVAPIYGVPVEHNAHDASADCLMTGRIAAKQIESWQGTLAGLHDKQVGWASEQASSLEDYFDRSGKREPDGSKIIIDRQWPMKERTW